MINDGDSLRDMLDSLPPDYIRRQKKLNQKDLENLKQLFSKLSEDDKSGKPLEVFVSNLMNSIQLHEINNNIRTSTNEIDLFLRTNDITRAFYEKTLPILKENFIIECKQYHEKINVTWVNKFYSLLRQGDYKIGIIFSLELLTGKNEWDSSKGVCSKVALKDDIFILNFYKKDMEDILNGKNFIDIVEEKLIQLKENIKIKILSHQNEKYVN
ncbi:TPA: restriction endonuclease [Staphylococcus aureus]|nr:restriction endonuclease [Staphylococcus aureus]